MNASCCCIIVLASDKTNLSVLSGPQQWSADQKGPVVTQGILAKFSTLSGAHLNGQISLRPVKISLIWISLKKKSGGDVQTFSLSVNNIDFNNLKLKNSLISSQLCPASWWWGQWWWWSWWWMMDGGPWQFHVYSVLAVSAIWSPVRGCMYSLHLTM